MSGAAFGSVQDQGPDIEGWIRVGSVLLSLLAALLLAWIVVRSNRRVLDQADPFLLRHGPADHGSVLSLSHSEEGRTWRAWATCFGSAQALTLRGAATFQSVGAPGLARAAGQVRMRLHSGSDEPDPADELARALSVWPHAQVWLDPRRGALVALDPPAHSACLLVSNVLTQP